MLMIVGFFTYKGSDKIEKFLSVWSFLLYAVYIIFLVITFTKFGDRIIDNFSHAEADGNWPVSSLQYAFYNLANVVGVIFCIRYVETRKEAIANFYFPCSPFHFYWHLLLFLFSGSLI